MPMEERARRFDALHAGRREGKAVSEIARELGIKPDDFFRWIERENAATEREQREARMKQRKCLRCAKRFLSEGAHHRMCDACRNYAPVTDSPYTPDPGGSRGRQVPRAGRAR